MFHNGTLTEAAQLSKEPAITRRPKKCSIRRILWQRLQPCLRRKSLKIAKSLLLKDLVYKINHQANIRIDTPAATTATAAWPTSKVEVVEEVEQLQEAPMAPLLATSLTAWLLTKIWIWYAPTTHEEMVQQNKCWRRLGEATNIET